MCKSFFGTVRCKLLEFTISRKFLHVESMMAHRIAWYHSIGVYNWIEVSSKYFVATCRLLYTKHNLSAERAEERQWISPPDGAPLMFREFVPIIFKRLVNWCCESVPIKLERRIAIFSRFHSILLLPSFWKRALQYHYIIHGRSTSNIPICLVANFDHCVILHCKAVNLRQWYNDHRKENKGIDCCAEY